MVQSACPWSRERLLLPELLPVCTSSSVSPLSSSSFLTELSLRHYGRVGAGDQGGPAPVWEAPGSWQPGVAQRQEHGRLGPPLSRPARGCAPWLPAGAESGARPAGGGPDLVLGERESFAVQEFGLTRGPSPSPAAGESSLFFLSAGEKDRSPVTAPQAPPKPAAVGVLVHPGAAGLTGAGSENRGSLPVHLAGSESP